jgi:DNA-directed RNA polymerase specialized sigma24 family protein
MHYVLGMTVAEMSNELRVPVETIRSRLRVGMGQVRAELGMA